MRVRQKPVFAFLPNHPSQIWVLKPVAEMLERNGRAKVIWFLRDKDVSVELARRLEIPHIIISRARTGLVGNAWELFINIFKCAYYTLRLGIDAWVTKYGCGSIASVLTGRTSIGFNDDDADVVPLIAATCYPFSKAVLVPTVTRMGRFEAKARRYPSSHELFYLHPNRFHPGTRVRAFLGLREDEPYALIRLSALQAHHDVGIRGVGTEVVRKVLSLCSERGIRVFITSEKPLESEFEPHRLPIPVDMIHDALAFAEFLIGDSQTMTAEAATMGTPSFRLSDFFGRISYIDELERFGLSFGYKPDDWKRMLTDIEEYVHNPSRKGIIRERLEKFLAAKSDPVPWFAENLLELAGCRLTEKSPIQQAPDATK